MNKFSFLNVINVIKYLSVIAVMICICIAYKSIMSGDIFIIVFIATMIVYFVYTIIKFLIKDSNEALSLFKNIITIMLNGYILLVVCKEYTLINSIIYSINETYFMINYIIIIFVTIVLMVSDFFKPKENIKISWYFYFL